MVASKKTSVTPQKRATGLTAWLSAGSGSKKADSTSASKDSAFPLFNAKFNNNGLTPMTVPAAKQQVEASTSPNENKTIRAAPVNNAATTPSNGPSTPTARNIPTEPSGSPSRKRASNGVLKTQKPDPEQQSASPASSSVKKKAVVGKTGGPTPQIQPRGNTTGSHGRQITLNSFLGSSPLDRSCPDGGLEGEGGKRVLNTPTARARSKLIQPPMSSDIDEPSDPASKPAEADIFAPGPSNPDKKKQYKQAHLDFSTGPFPVNIETASGSSTSTAQQPRTQPFSFASTPTKGKPKVVDDLDIGLLNASSSLPEFPLVAEHDTTDEEEGWRRLSMSDSLDLMMVVQFVKTFKLGLLGLDEDFEVSLAHFEEALYSPSTFHTYLTTLYTHFYRLIDPTTNITQCASLARISTFLSSLNPTLSQTLSTTEFPSLLPIHHLQALKTLTNNITSGLAFKSYIDEIDDRLSQLRKNRWKRAGEIKAAEAAIPELERQVAEWRLKKKKEEDGKGGAGKTRTRGRMHEFVRQVSDVERRLEVGRERVKGLREEEEREGKEMRELGLIRRSG
ncbi:hypothetical protein HK097_000511, partial [Rhizophlyctis rosea]